MDARQGVRMEPPSAADGGYCSHDPEACSYFKALRQGKLIGRLLKQNHAQNILTADFATRICEVDDALMVLLVYRNSELQRLAQPHHVYALHPAVVKPMHEQKGRVDASLIPRDVFRMELTVPGSLPIILGCSSPAERDRWLDAFRLRIEQAKSRMVFLQKPRNRHGLSCSNFSAASIGALITDVEKGSPAADAEICTGEVLVAVAGRAVFSHSHASKLLDDCQLAHSVELIIAAKPTLADWRQDAMQDAVPESEGNVDVS